MNRTHTSSDEFTPAWATHPGQHIDDYLEANNWSQAELARRAGLTPKLVNEIISGKNPVSPDTAIRLERVLGLKAEIWLGLQSDWDLHAARQREARLADERKDWLKQFPLKELIARGALTSTKHQTDLINELLALFGVGSPEGYLAKTRSLAVHHRQSAASKSSPDHVFAWLMLGERKARALNMPAFSETKFLSAVTDIRQLTRESPSVFEEVMLRRCAEAGVAVVFEQPISKTRLFGSARWIDDNRAIIQMSLRMKTNDHFWWTFFHECAHVILHKGENFADDPVAASDEREKQADRWAENLLYGSEVRLSKILNQRPCTARQVQDLADQLNLHPGIIVGMLQHYKVTPHHQLNYMKLIFDWAS